jgi:hypothetical protein
MSLSRMLWIDFHPYRWAAGPCETRKFCFKLELPIEEE